MREISVDAVAEHDPEANLTDLLGRNAAEQPDAVQFARPGPDGWQDVTCSRFLAEVTALAKGMIAAGISPGDRVGLMAKTRYEWTLTDFAVWCAGGVVVPIYETSSAEQVFWILSDSAATACMVESAEHAALLAGVRDRLPELKHSWVIDDGAVEQLSSAGDPVGDDVVAERRAGLDGASVATLIYTAGTTGRPKGCELTHANFLDLTRNAEVPLRDILGTDASSTLLFLPLAHVFARFVEVLCVTHRVKLAHTPSIANLVPDLQSFRPTFVLAVPRVFEKIYNSAETRAQAAGRGRVFEIATRAAIAYSEALDAGGPGVGLRLRHAVFDRLVYSKLRAATGGRVTRAVSGGGPLGTRLGHFFRGAGITIYEGWGLTETTAPVSVNTRDHQRIGSVGRPLPGVSVRVSDDGELLVSGINVMRGYVNNPQASAEALTDGWLRTGDLGQVDDDGYITITGRKKEIIVTAAGKNVAPTMLEDRLRQHLLVSQCMVVGDRRPFVGCLVTLDAEMLPVWLSSHGKPELDVAAAADDPDVRAEIQHAVDDANSTVSRPESIRKFVILDTDFTEASGHLTPKLSLKRPVVMKEFAEHIERLYS